MRLPERALLLALIAGPAIGPAAAKLAVDFRPNAPFATYDSYAWGPGTPARREQVQRQITTSVDRELAADGLRQVATEPDLLVEIHVLVDEHTLEELDDPDHWAFWRGITDVDSLDLGAGTLVIDFVEARSGELVWRGLATKTVASDPGPKTLAKIDKLVTKLLARFPPRP